jgi:hypothetical protein
MTCSATAYDSDAGKGRALQQRRMYVTMGIMLSSANCAAINQPGHSIPGRLQPASSETRGCSTAAAQPANKEPAALPNFIASHAAPVGATTKTAIVI